MDQLWQGVRGRWERGRQSLRRLAEECRTCRSCGTTVNPLEEICPTCGAAHPVTVPVSPTVLIAVFAGVAVLLLFFLT